MITFPYMIIDHGFVRIRRPNSLEINRIVKVGDVFVVSPEGELHHNHDVVCHYNGLTDTFEFFPK